jgi:hypothetical protein
MSSTPIVLHIGAMKTGSSALQASLTEHSVRKSLHDPGKTVFEYAALAPWALLRGDALRQARLHNPDLYVCSAPMDMILEENPQRRNAALHDLQTMRSEGRIPILSNERWLHQQEKKSIHAFAVLLGGPLHVVAYIRPQVDFLNSMFWQTLRIKSSAYFIPNSLKTCDWARQLELWKSAPGVESLSIRLKCSDIVTDFCQLIGCEHEPVSKRVNQTFPAALCHFIDRWNLSDKLANNSWKPMFFRWLSVHDPTGAALEGLGQQAFFIDGKTIRKIVRHFRGGNERLIGWCEKEIAEAMRAEPRWWSPDSNVHQPRNFVFRPNRNKKQKAPGRRLEPPLWSYREKLLEADKLIEATLGALVQADAAHRAALLELEQLKSRTPKEAPVGADLFACSGMAGTRESIVLSNVPTHLPGIEFFGDAGRVVDGLQHDVLHVTGTFAQQRPEKAKETDVFWGKGEKLSALLGRKTFSYAVASHVLQYAANPLGFINEILDVLEPGAKLLLLLRDMRADNSPDRPETSFAEVAGWSIEAPECPTPIQALNCFDRGNAPFTDEQITDFCRNSSMGMTLEKIRCSSWTPAGFVKTWRRLEKVGLLHASVGEASYSLPGAYPDEFSAILSKPF